MAGNWITLDSDGGRRAYVLHSLLPGDKVRLKYHRLIREATVVSVDMENRKVELDVVMITERHPTPRVERFKFPTVNIVAIKVEKKVLE